MIHDYEIWAERRRANYRYHLAAFDAGGICVYYLWDSSLAELLAAAADIDAGCDPLDDGDDAPDLAYAELLAAIRSGGEIYRIDLHGDRIIP